MKSTTRMLIRPRPTATTLEVVVNHGAYEAWPGTTYLDVAHQIVEARGPSGSAQKSKIAKNSRINQKKFVQKRPPTSQLGDGGRGNVANDFEKRLKETLALLMEEGGAEVVFKEVARMAYASGVPAAMPGREKLQARNTDSKSVELPSPPAGFDSWPSEKFDDAPERGKKEGIIKFLRRVWRPYIDAAAVSRPILTRIDPLAEKAVRNYMQNNGNPRPLPDDLFIPTIDQVNDMEIARVGLSKKGLRRLASAMNRRSPR